MNRTYRKYRKRKAAINAVLLWVSSQSKRTVKMICEWVNVRSVTLFFASILFMGYCSTSAVYYISNTNESEMRQRRRAAEPETATTITTKTLSFNRIDHKVYWFCSSFSVFPLAVWCARNQATEHSHVVVT